MTISTLIVNKLSYTMLLLVDISGTITKLVLQYNVRAENQLKEFLMYLNSSRTCHFKSSNQRPTKRKEKKKKQMWAMRKMGIQLTLNLRQGTPAIVPNTPSKQIGNQKHEGIDISGHPWIGAIPELAKPWILFEPPIAVALHFSVFTSNQLYSSSSFQGLHLRCQRFGDFHLIFSYILLLPPPLRVVQLLTVTAHQSH